MEGPCVLVWRERSVCTGVRTALMSSIPPFELLQSSHIPPPMSGPPLSSSTQHPSVRSFDTAGNNGASTCLHVDLLLLGSGWTSAWLLPQLFSEDIAFAYTNRSGIKPDWLAIPGSKPIKWVCPSSGDSRIHWRRSFKDFPIARLVVVILPLADEVVARELVASYSAHVNEKGASTADRPKWCILGSTGAYGKGQFNENPTPSVLSSRSTAESVLLTTYPTDITVLSLAGLYGGDTRHPLNWLAKVASDEAKLAAKTSLHLVHGKDVAEAVLGVWGKVGRPDWGRTDTSFWGKRWIVTDGCTYDWWKLAIELPPAGTEEQTKYAEWVRILQKAHKVSSLPRSFAETNGGAQSYQYLDRTLSSKSFWDAVGRSPTKGPATQVDLPISPVSGKTIGSATQRAGPSLQIHEAIPQASECIQRWIPVISKARLQDLIACLQHEIGREAQFPFPPIFEGRKERFGLTHQHFLSLRKGWLEYLTSTNSHTETWSEHWKEILTYDHYYAREPDKLTGSYVSGTLDGLHFVRVQPRPETGALGRRIEPLLFLHGWPGSFLEGLFVARAMANPGPDVALNQPAFDVIIPSMPGYAWSGSPIVKEDTGDSCFSGPEGDLLVPDVADLVDGLMSKIFASQESTGPFYSITAGDWGASVARRCAVRHRDKVRAIHLNFMPAPPPALAPPMVPGKVLDVAASHVPGFAALKNLPRTLGQEHFLPKPIDSSHTERADYGSASSLGTRLKRLLGLPAPLNEKDAQRVQQGLEFQSTGRAYAQFHGSRPSTLGNITHSSPSALLSWIGEKFFAWTDPHHPLAASIIFESLTLWWCTETMARALYPYRNCDIKDGPLSAVAKPENFIHVPTGYSMAPYELIPSPLTWSKGTANIVWHREHEKGGHFLATERPNKYVQDVRDFLQAVLDG